MFPHKRTKTRVGPDQNVLWEMMNRVLVTGIVMGIFLVLLPREAPASSPLDVTLSSTRIGQGDLCLIQVRVEKGEEPRVTWRKKHVYLVPNREKTLWYGMLSADLRAQKGDFEVTIEVAPAGKEKKLKVGIVEKSYGVRRLTLPKKMVDLDKEALARARKESRAMKALWRAAPTAPLWRGAFIRPVPGIVVGPFGRSSIINNQPRSPHSGVDLRGKKGTPVAATNHGKVVLTGDHFFTGLTVVIDHGGGIQSMYFHLARVLVKKGDTVDKGQVIGQVGSTGRSSGPHLHWGVRVNGDRVDPIGLTEISKGLAAAATDATADTMADPGAGAARR